MPLPRPSAFSRLALAALAPLALTAPAGATDFTDNVSVQSALLCVGSACGTSATETTWGAEGLKIKSETPSIRFEDTTDTGFGDRDWNITANNNSTSENFYVYDVQGTSAPFWIEGGSRSNALRISQTNGQIGFGTAFPADALHIVSDVLPAIRLERPAAGGFPPYTWRIVGIPDFFTINDPIAQTYPFLIASGAPNYALVVAQNGNIGIGKHGAGNIGVALDPAAGLHLANDNGTARMLIEENSATSNPRTLLNLQNNGRPEIVMGNTATNGEWSFGAGTDFFLKTGTVGSQSNAKTKVFTVKQNGDAIVFGTLTTGGTTCGGGCDAVFSPDYNLPSIADHAAQMKTLGYLPNIGPTPEGQPFNLTDKLGRMLNELEHAHLYIAQQQTALRSLEDLNRAQAGLIAGQQAALSATNARLAALTARLDALERPSAQP